MRASRRLLLAALPFALAACRDSHDPPPPPPEPAPLRNTIVFVSDRAGPRHVYTMDPDGRNVTQRTMAVLGVGAQVSVSPDGKWIVFDALRDATRDLWVMGADGASLRRLTTSNVAEHDVAWSPDGQLIAFAAPVGGQDDIYVVRPDGSGLRQLTDDPGEDNEPSWSPDGQFLVFSSTRGSETGLPDLYRMRADGTELVRLTDHPGTDSQGAWSPDGRTIAFHSMRDGPNQAYLLDLASGSITRVAEQAYVAGIAWSPDGQELLLTLTVDAIDLYRMRRDGTALTRLTSGAGRNFGATWVP